MRRLVTAAAALPAQPSPYAVLRNRSFRRIWTAQLVSTVGDALTSLAAGIIVYERTGSVAERRADADGYRGPDARRGPHRRGRRRPLRSEEDHGRLRPDPGRPGGDAAVSARLDRQRRLALRRGNALVIGHPVLLARERERPAGDRLRGGAGGRQRDHGDRPVRFDGGRLRRGGVPGDDEVDRAGLLHRLGHLPLLGADDQPRQGRQARGHRAHHPRRADPQHRLRRRSSSGGRRSCAA